MMCQYRVDILRKESVQKAVLTAVEAVFDLGMLAALLSLYAKYQCTFEYSEIYLSL